jgi:hypothetical protein
MPTLSDARLAIKIASGSSNATVTASVDVSFSAQEKALIKLFEQAGAPLRYRVTCRIRGADSPDPDNALFTLGSESVNTDRNNIPFEKVVSLSSLDEDSGTFFGIADGDEVYARFTCTPPANTGLSLTAATPLKSHEIHGSF